MKIIKAILFFMGYAHVPLEIIFMAEAIIAECAREKPNMTRIKEMAIAIEGWGRSARLCYKEE